MRTDGSDEETSLDKPWFRRVNWAGLFAGAVITTVVAALGSYAVQRSTNAEPKLEYLLFVTPRLFGSLEESRLYTLTTSNTGDENVDDLRIGVDFDGGVVDEFDVDAPAALPLDDDLLENSSLFVVETETLNPGDQITLSFLVSFSETHQDPEIDVRGEGITGVPQEIGSRQETPFFLVTIVSLAAAMSGILSIMLRARSRRGPHPSDFILAGHAREPRHVQLASACLDLGLLDLAKEYVSGRRIDRWWLEADLLTSRALSGGAEVVTPAQALQLLEKILQEGVPMARTSAAIINIDIARLALSVGLTDRAKSALAEAEKDDTEELRRRKILYEELRI